MSEPSSVPVAKESESHPLILTPDKTLTFSWKSAETGPKTTLTVKCSGNDIVVYKVKTTQPKRYVVRPPQGCVLPGNRETINLSMVTKDSEALWAKAAADKGIVAKSEDKFMVQAAVVSQEYYNEFLDDRDEKQLGDNLQKLWQKMTDSDKKSTEGKQIKSTRLMTKFDFPASLSAPVKAEPEPTSSIGSFSKTADPSKTSDAIFTDISALRKKYDDMVAYSVVLTGERDYLNGELELAKQRIQRLEKEKTADSGESATTAVLQAKKEADSVGFSFVQVMVMILVGFILGRVFS